MIKKTIEHNCETGEVITRELNADELADSQSIKQRIAEIVNGIEAKATAKAALLDRLGITEDEAKLLLS